MKKKLFFGLLLLAMMLPAWELPVKIDGSAGSHYFTQVRFDSTQTAYILYTAGPHVMFARYNGEKAEVLKEIGDPEMFNCTPWMFIDENDLVHIVWAEATARTSDDYYIRYRTFNGTEFSPVSTIIKLFIGGNTIHYSAPPKTEPLRMIMDKQGNMFIVFMDATKYRSRFISKYGDVVKAESFPAEAKSKFPDVAVDENYVHVTWQAGLGASNPDGGYTVFWGRRENKVDGAWLEAIDIKEGQNWDNSAHWPLVTKDENGKLHFIWQDDGDPRARIIFYKFWDGEQFSPRVNISGTPHYLSNNSLRAKDENNVFIAGHMREIFTMYAWKRNGAWSDYQPIPGLGALKPDSECADVTKDFKVAAVSFSSEWAATYVVASSKFKATQRPLAVINADKSSIFWMDSVSFDGSQSHDPDGSVVRYVWDFGDGEKAEGSTTSHVFAKKYGDVTVKLTVYDDKGAIGIATKTFVVKALYTANATYERKKIRTIIYDRFGYAISWTPNSKNAQAGYNIVGYKIFRRVVGDSGDYSEIGQVDAAHSGYADMGIDQTSAKEYEYAVCPVDDQGHYSPVDNFGTVANAVLPRKLLGSEVLKNTRN